LSQEIENYKDALEELNEMCEVLMEKSACSLVRDQATGIQDEYNKILTEIQGEAFVIVVCAVCVLCVNEILNVVNCAIFNTRRLHVIKEESAS
jgi:hypothetical protein